MYRLTFTSLTVIRRFLIDRLKGKETLFRKSKIFSDVIQLVTELFCPKSTFSVVLVFLKKSYSKELISKRVAHPFTLLKAHPSNI